jgi:ribose/xylose/arabinose/galactoside ABC-type transport system permease subunit
MKSKVTKDSVIDFCSKNAIILALIALVIVMTVLRPTTFLTVNNIVSIIKQSSVQGVLAVGMTFVLLIGGIDLSVGSILAVSGLCAAICAAPGGLAQGLGGYNATDVVENPLPLIVPIVVAILIGAIFGVFNGVVNAKGHVPAFIVTMGTMTIARGTALLITNGANQPYLTDEFKAIGKGSLFGIAWLPYLVIIFIAIVIIAYFILNKTKFGRHIYAIGGNEVAANASGIKVDRIKIIVYIISGICCGISGLLLASRTSTGAPAAGEGYELDAIAACVLGGVSLNGGVGRVSMSVVGIIFIGCLSTGLDMVGVNPYWQKIVKGAIIILAVLFDQINQSRMMNKKA